MTTTASRTNGSDGLDRFHADNTASNQTGVTLMNTPEGEIIANIMAKKPNVSIRHLPSMIRVDGINKLDFDMDEISEAVSHEFTPAHFEEVMSTHYGRMVVLDDHVYLFANPEDAAEYIGFDLTPVN
jgi:propane monooxygenase coupling protein